MPETLFQSEPAASEASRLRLMLRTWEAVSTERELPGVLASLADVLVPLVPFDSIGIIDFTVPKATVAQTMQSSSRWKASWLRARIS